MGEQEVPDEHTCSYYWGKRNQNPGEKDEKKVLTITWSPFILNLVRFAMMHLREADKKTSKKSVDKMNRK